MSFNKDTNKYEGYIYLINNNINGKQYIGQTISTIKHRWGQHTSCRNGHHNMPVVAAINKYGKENFSINEIKKYESDTKEDLLNILNNEEVRYIDEYNTLSPNGYNITIGGNNTSSSLAKPVDAYSYDGTFLNSFDSASEADRYYDLAVGSAIECCTGNILLTGNKQYTFRYKGEPFDKFDVYHYKRSTYIYKFDLDGNFIKKYSNATQAGSDLDNTSTSAASMILSVIDNPSKTAYGFYWSSTGNFDFDIKNYRNRVSIDQYDFDGNKLNTYISASEACKSIGKSIDYVSQILRVCRGESSHAFNFIWRFEGDAFDLYDLPIRLSKVPVDKYTTDGEFVHTYNSYQDALRDLGKRIDQGCSIRKACLGISPIVFGYVWRFRGEPFSKYPVYKNRGGSDKAVDKYTIDGNFVETYSSAAEGGRSIGLANGSQITQVCKGNRYSAGGYLWRYSGIPLDSFTVIPKKASPRKGQSLNVYSLNDEFLYTASSATEMAEKYNCSKDTIRNRCNGKIANHIFEDIKIYYISDPTQPDKSRIVEVS